MALEVAYSPLLVCGSLAVAIMAAFTALRLTSNLRDLDAAARKVRVTQGALALGIGIWSMHFTGMLAIELPITISYDPVRTLASALIAVLVVGVALLSLHFGIRSRSRIYIAGTLTGFGIVGMHYLGMSAISANCLVSYSPYGIVLAVGIGIASSIAAIELAYGNRSLLSTVAGATVLGLAISAMHYSAMYFTVFSIGAKFSPVSSSVLDNERLALVVVLSSFVLSGLFLLMAVPTENKAAKNSRTATKTAEGNSDGIPATEHVAEATEQVKIPYEQNKVQRTMPAKTIHIIKADGHYTRINNGGEDLFCPWSISRIEKSLNPSDFMRTHRSFIVNKHLITGFRRDGDKAYCLVGNNQEIEIPISRSRISALREFLQLS